MERLNFPDYKFVVREGSGGKKFIFDSFRKKDLILTPEEWVRQHLIRFLIEEKDYPAALISIEAGVKINSLARRYDALVYSRAGKPIMLVECKAPGVKIGQQTFDQILAYNQSIKAPYLIVTNGIKHFCCRLKADSLGYDFLNDIPAFTALN